MTSIAILLGLLSLGSIIVFLISSLIYGFGDALARTRPPLSRSTRTALLILVVASIIAYSPFLTLL